MPRPAALLALPGPQAFLRRVAQDAADGWPVVLVVPDRLGSEEFLEALERNLEDLLPRSSDLVLASADDRAGGSSWSELWRLLVPGEAPPVSSATDFARQLAARGVTGTFLVVPTWQLPERQRPAFGDVLSALARRVKLGDSAGANVICVTTLAGLAHLPQADVTVRVHWWWRVVHRLDTQVEVWRSCQDVVRDDVAREVVVEVAAWDLDAVPTILHAWDGSDVSSLVCVLRDLLADATAHDEDGRSGDGASSHMIDELDGRHSKSDGPSVDEVAAWAAGCVQRWDGVTRARPALLTAIPDGADRIHRLVWSAQLRSFMPQLDRWRQQAEERLRERIPDDELTLWLDTYWNAGRPTDQHLELDSTLEANVLSALIKNHPAMVDLRNGYLEKLVKYIRYTRNNLSHLRCISAEDVQKGHDRAGRALPS